MPTNPTTMPTSARRFRMSANCGCLRPRAMRPRAVFHPTMRSVRDLQINTLKSSGFRVTYGDGHAICLLRRSTHESEEHIMRWIAVGMLALSVVAGGSDAPSAPAAPTVIGTWALESIDGARLPFLLDQAGADKLELLEATITA